MANSEIMNCQHCGRRNRAPAAASGTPRCGHCHQPLPWIVDAGDESFAEVAERSSVPALVDLWAPWCGPCRMVSPALEQLANENAGRLKLVKVNVDNAPKIQQRFGVQAIPTLLLLRNGEVAARQTGAAPAAALRTWLDGALAARPGAADHRGIAAARAALTPPGPCPTFWPPAGYRKPAWPAPAYSRGAAMVCNCARTTSVLAMWSPVRCR